MTVRGWCPGVHEPMASGDGLLVRVKPPGGRLPSVALHAVADAAEAHGNGVIELTSRGNLQIRGLTAASAPEFARAMVAVGLADPDPEHESRRNVIVLPPYDDALAAEVEAVLSDTAGLASKFCIAIGAAEADIVIDAGLIDGQEPFTLAALRRVIAAAAGQRLPRRPVSRAVPHGLLHIPFGQTSATLLRGLADVTDSARTTPYRALSVAAGCTAAGFVTDPADPRLRIAACPGAPSCRSGQTPARADAATLAASGIGDVHVSGCDKGCAMPRPARTLVGRNGRYDLVRHGRAHDQPDLMGLSLAQAAAALA